MPVSFEVSGLFSCCSSPQTVISMYTCTVRLNSCLLFKVAQINAAVDSGDLSKLLKTLLNDKAKLNKVTAENGDWYQQTLAEVKQGKVSMA